MIEKCECGCKRIAKNIRSIDGGVPSEIEYKCLFCNTVIDYFAYGYYMSDLYATSIDL